MKNSVSIIKTIGLFSFLIILLYPSYDLVRDFTTDRNIRFQSTHYQFSRYLRHRG